MSDVGQAAYYIQQISHLDAKDNWLEMRAALGGKSAWLKPCTRREQGDRVVIEACKARNTLGNSNWPDGHQEVTPSRVAARHERPSHTAGNCGGGGD